MNFEALAILVLGSGLTTYVMTGIKKLYAKIDTLSPTLQQVIVALIAFGVAKLSLLLGVPLPADPSKWTGDIVNTVIIGLSALGLHNLRKSHTS